jgi:DNA-binding NarL/FixJ family response regulator
MKRPHVLIADDHQILLEGLRQLLAPDYNLAGMAADGRELLALGRQTRPDLIVTDIDMPGLTGPDAIAQLKREGITPKVIYLTMLADMDTAVSVFRAGAAGYILKHSAVTELLAAIKEVLAGRVYITPRISKEMLGVCLHSSSHDALSRPAITPRQAEVLRLIAQGLTMKEVAAALDISKRTAEAHKYQMMEHLGLRTLAELIQYGLRTHILATHPSTSTTAPAHASASGGLRIFANHRL